MDGSVQNQFTNECDRVKLQRIFPSEIWLYVFEQLNTSTDLQTCANASPFMSELLQPRKAVYLFPDVLKILDNNKYVKYGDGTQMLKYRLVCSGWKRATEELLQIRHYHFKLRKRNEKDCLPKEFFSDISYDTHFSLYKFNIGQLEDEILPELSSDFYQSHCPFPSRHLTIEEYQLRKHQPNYADDGNQYFLWANDVVRYRSAAMSFLKKVGHHFWHAVIQVNQMPVEWYRTLRDYVGHMPNLKSLYIKINSLSTAVIYCEALSAYLADNALPFPSLRSLQLISCDRVPGSALNEILSAHMVDVVEIYRIRSDDFRPNSIQCTTHLSIFIFNSDELNGLPANGRLLELKLTFHETMLMRFPEIFNKLECYRESLEDLTIEFSSNVSFDRNGVPWDYSKTPLRLPKLKRLEISIFTYCPITVDFLLALESLEFLCLRLTPRTHDLLPHESSRINMDSIYGQSLIESNIWELMPNLLEVDLALGQEATTRKFRRPLVAWD